MYLLYLTFVVVNAVILLISHMFFIVEVTELLYVEQTMVSLQGLPTVVILISCSPTPSSCQEERKWLVCLLFSIAVQLVLFRSRM